MCLSPKATHEWQKMCTQAVSQDVQRVVANRTFSISQLFGSLLLETLFPVTSFQFVRLRDVAGGCRGLENTFTELKQSDLRPSLPLIRFIPLLQFLRRVYLGGASIEGLKSVGVAGCKPVSNSL
ncbi:hypothetical protein AC579_8732 [Pseudocercospora musae]|uniref:Uncharacterized protein n=1 Tax=Pseudocercospora musae TaxID=113226 RepID=A0A139IWG5_9PEZI|nr:hypothetical protein AC579_8732 [Pseudocercospora musae]